MEAENIAIINLWFMQLQQELLMSKSSSLSHSNFFFQKAFPNKLLQMETETENSNGEVPPLGLLLALLLRYLSMLIDHDNKFPEFFLFFCS